MTSDNTAGGLAGCEAMTVTLTESVYTFFVHDYQSPNTRPFFWSQAKINVYGPGSSTPIYTTKAPEMTSYGRQPEGHEKFWVAFCIDGSRGIAGIHTVDEYEFTTPLQMLYCPTDELKFVDFSW